MPVDPSGVTTDDHGQGGGGAEQQRSEEPTAGRAPVADPHAGLPPVAGTRPDGGNGSNGHDEAGLPPTGRADVTDRFDGDTRGSDPDVAAADARHQGWAAVADPEVGSRQPRGGNGPPDDSLWSTFTPAARSSAPSAPEEGPAHTPSAAVPPPAPATGPEIDPGGTEPFGAGVPEPSTTRRLAARIRPRRAPKRKARRGLRVRQRLWSFDPWSVFKLSVLFYICVCLIVVVAGTLLWNVGRSVGTIDDVESFITRMGAYGTCTLKAEVPAGVEFEQDDDCADDEVLVGGYTFDDGTLFRVAAIGGGILVVAGSIGNVLMVVLLNLLNELTGGLRYTIVKEPILPQPGTRQGGRRPPAAQAAPGRPGGPRHAAKHRALAMSSVENDGDDGDRDETIRVPAVESSTDRGIQG